MKNLPWFLTISVVIICSYIVFHKPSATEREKSLEADVRLRDKRIQRLEDNGNLMADEIRHKDVIISEAHEETLKATAARIYAERKLDFFKISPVSHYTGKQRDSVLRAIADEWRRNEGAGRLGRP